MDVNNQKLIAWQNSFDEPWDSCQDYEPKGKFVVIKLEEIYSELRGKHSNESIILVQLLAHYLGKRARGNNRYSNEKDGRIWLLS